MQNKSKLLNVSFAVLFIILLVFITFLLLPQYKTYENMKKKIDNLTTNLQENKNKYLELNSIIYKLEKDPKMIEKIARNKYNFCKKGEIIFNVTP